MTVKFLAGKSRLSAIVTLCREELAAAGTRPGELTLLRPSARRILLRAVELTADCAGISRDGRFVTVACRPLKSGGCRLTVDFRTEPSDRLFVFDCCDDMLDALRLLAAREDFDLSSAITEKNGPDYYIRTPASQSLSPAALCILSEYSSDSQ